jgi:hypothetical protein
MIQAIQCKCGKFYAGYMVPQCYKDTDWQKKVKDWLKNGYTMQFIENKHFKIDKCTCNETKNEYVQAKLF